MTVRAYLRRYKWLFALVAVTIVAVIVVGSWMVDRYVADRHRREVAVCETVNTNSQRINTVIQDLRDLVELARSMKVAEPTITPEQRQAAEDYSTKSAKLLGPDYPLIPCP